MRAETRERINRALLGPAQNHDIEKRHKVRIDSTVTETHIWEPVDSHLLSDAVRVLLRVLARDREKLGPPEWAGHERVLEDWPVANQ